MGNIELTGEKLQELMESMNPEAKVIFEKLLMTAASVQPLKDIKEWVHHFDQTCPVDNLIARIVAQAIHDIGSGITADMKKTAESGGREYTGHDAANIAIQTLKNMGVQLEKHLAHGNCAQCASGTKH